MVTAAAAVAVASGFVIAVLASRRAVANTAEIAAGSRIPRFVIGFTLLALGTDLPEIANSIIASLADHGDLNVGDSVGSAATQVTLVLGLMPLLAGVSFSISQRRFGRASAATVGALLLGLALMSDGDVTRLDALVLIGAWVFGSYLIWDPDVPGTQLDLPLETTHKGRKILMIFLSLGIVAGGATLAIWGMTELAETVGVPQYLMAFFLASLGTSLPELVVVLTAARQGQKDLAIGDATGATFVDSTLSVGIGPLIAPITVTSSLVVRGSLLAASAVALVGLTLVVRKRHDRLTSVFLVLVYLAFYAVFALT